MAKTRLINVDEIVTSGGLKLELTPMLIEGHQADGHSSNANRVMFAAGNDSAHNSCTHVDIKQFASDGWNANHGYLNSSRCNFSGASDGTKAMFAGGYPTPSYTRLSSCEMKQFASDSWKENHGNLTEARAGLAAASDGTQAMFAGGWSQVTWNNVNTVDMKQFSTDATAVDHGDLTVARTSISAGSDGTQVMFGGGAGENTSIVEKKQFATNATAVNHGNLAGARWGMGSASDGTQVMFCSGDNTEATYSDATSMCEMKQFDTSATAVSHGSMTAARMGLSGGSDGTKAMFGGGWTWTSLNTCDMKQFSNSSNAVSHGTLANVRRFHGAASGDA